MKMRMIATRAVGGAMLIGPLLALSAFVPEIRGVLMVAGGAVLVFAWCLSALYLLSH